MEEVTGCREKYGPGKKPDEYQNPEEGQRNRFIVERLALAEKAQELFIHEEIPKETRIAARRQHMPRNCKRQEEENSPSHANSLQALPVPHPEKKEERKDGHGKNQAQQAFSQHCPGEGGIEQHGGQDRIVRPGEPPPEGRQAQGKEKHKQHIRKDHAREQEASHAEGRGQAGGKPGRRFTGLPHEIEQADSSDQSQHRRQPRGKLRHTEQFVRQRHEPVHHRRFVEESDSVGVRRDPVASRDHLLGYVRIERVAIIENGSLCRRVQVGPGYKNQKQRQIQTSPYHEFPFRQPLKFEI